MKILILPSSIKPAALVQTITWIILNFVVRGPFCRKYLLYNVTETNDVHLEVITPNMY